LDLLRRTRATRLYQDGVSLPLVSRLLGHTQLETTKIYASPSLEMMRDAMSAASAEQVKNEKPLWTSGAEAEDESAAKLGLR
jgi:integrase